MKAYFLILISLLIFCSGYAQKVEVLQVGDKCSFTSVAFTDSLTGHAVGHDGVIMKTIDGGNSWTRPYTVCENTLQSVFFIDKNNGYAVGDKGTFIQTKDGGLSWTNNETESTVNLNSVYFTNINKGFAVGDSGVILKTTDRGRTFTSLNSGTELNLNSICFLNTGNGFVIGEEGLILKTMDGGANWVSINSNTKNDLNSIYFPDSIVGFIVGMQGTILKTENGGTIWGDKSPDMDVPLISVYFKDRENGMSLDAKSTLVRTTDGGNNWQFEDSGLLYKLRSFYILDTNTFYAVTSRKSKILKFTGQGNSEKYHNALANPPKPDSLSIPKEKIVKFGLAFGVTNVSFKVDNYSHLGDNPDYQELPIYSNPYSVNANSYLDAHSDNALNNPGIKVGLVSEIKLHDNVRLRMIPGLLFWEKKVYFNTPIDDPNRYYSSSDITNYYKLFPTFIDVPVLFKLQSNQVLHKRPYLIFGGSYQRNISKSGEGEIIRISDNILNGEIGVGLNNYLKLTNLDVELKASFGLNNILEDNNRNLPQSRIYSQSIKSLTTNMITLSFMFE